MVKPSLLSEPGKLGSVLGLALAHARTLSSISGARYASSATPAIFSKKSWTLSNSSSDDVTYFRFGFNLTGLPKSMMFNGMSLSLMRRCPNSQRNPRTPTQPTFRLDFHWAPVAGRPSLRSLDCWDNPWKMARAGFATASR